MKYDSLLVFSKEIYRIFQLYYSLHGVKITIFSKNGKRLYPREKGADCEYCQLVRKDLGWNERCVILDNKMIESCIKGNKMISYRCHGGMQEAAIPLIIEDEPVGCIILGQFRWSENPANTPYLKEWQTKYGTDKLSKSFNKTPAYTGEKIPQLLELYQVILKFITKDKMIRHRELDQIMPIIRRLEENPKLNPSLDDVSQWISKSNSTTTRLFKKITGYSYKNYLINSKLDLAEDIMKDNQSMTIAEVAWKLGYNDPLYFSRLYRNYRGYSPRTFKDRIKTDLIQLNQDELE